MSRSDDRCRAARAPISPSTAPSRSSKLDNVLHVGRPAYGQANSTVGMFKLVDDGDAAVRVPVQLGRAR